MKKNPLTFARNAVESSATQSISLSLLVRRSCDRKSANAVSKRMGKTGLVGIISFVRYVLKRFTKT
jgi:hypothetical protein